MTIDYLSFPKASLRRVVHPGQQRVGHPHNNVAWGVPQQLLSQYYRPRKANGAEEWYLDADSPRWASELLPFVKAQQLYEPAAPSRPKSADDRERALRVKREAIDAYWEAVRALPGGADPLWRYGSDGDDITYASYLMRYTMHDDSNPQKDPWFPRVRLMLSYGTTSLREHARRHGLRYPGS